jgi:tetratricopeptide (TPR) repeat protein
MLGGGSIAGALLVLSVAAAQDDGASLAESAFTRGLELFEAGDFPLALAEFERSNELRSSPNSQLMIARILVELDRPAEAYVAYERAIAEARDRRRTDPRFNETLSHAESEQRELEPRVGWVRISATPAPSEGTLRIGARELPLAALDGWIVVDPGRVTVRIEARDHRPAARTLEVAAGAREAVALALVRNPVPEEPAPIERADGVETWGAISLVAGALAMATAIALGVWAAVIHADLDADCDGPCPMERADDVSLGRALEISTWATAIPGTALFGLGLALVLAL